MGEREKKPKSRWNRKQAALTELGKLALKAIEHGGGNAHIQLCNGGYLETSSKDESGNILKLSGKLWWDLQPKKEDDDDKVH